MREDIKERIELIREGKVPEGYKKTKLATLPSEWENMKLKELLVEVCKRTIDTVKYPLYSLTLEDGIVEKSERYDREHLVKKEDSVYKVVQPDEFVYNPMNIRFGAVARNKSGKSISVSGYYDVFKVKNSKDTEFMENYLISEQMIKYYNIVCTGSLEEKKRVHFSNFLQFELPMPVQEERSKISKILSIYDYKIDLLQKQFKLYEKEKIWLMRILLTGKKRVLRVMSDWKKAKMEQLFNERNETNLEGSELLSITAKGIVPRSELQGKDNSSADKSKYKRVCVGDIGYNTMRMWQGVSALSDYEGIVSPAYTVLIPNSDIDAKFFSYLFKLPSSIFKFYRYSQGLVDDTRNLKYDNFKKISFTYPSDVKEQRLIAEILSKADKEIELLEKKLELIKQEKKAMMQLLLTGIVRVSEEKREVN